MVEAKSEMVEALQVGERAQGVDHVALRLHDLKVRVIEREGIEELGLGWIMLHCACTISVLGGKFSST